MSIDYGTTTHAGITYTLTTQAELSGRLLGYGRAYHEAEDGEEYTFEMVAYGTNPSGERYRISWIFDAVKGDEAELDTYDYSAADDVAVIE